MEVDLNTIVPQKIDLKTRNLFDLDNSLLYEQINKRLTSLNLVYVVVKLINQILIPVTHMCLVETVKLRVNSTTTFAKGFFYILMTAK